MSDSNEPSIRPYDSDELLEEPYERAGRPDPPSYKPWHRPRKQFVRSRQWAPLVAELAKGIDDRNLRYLGLTGADFLDIRYLWEEACSAELSIEMVGFNEAAKVGSAELTYQDIALHALKQETICSQGSLVLPDNFRDISNKSSLAFQTVDRIGPFDIVNIDLCNGFWSDRPAGERTLYAVIEKIVQTIQTRSVSPWLLFLTTTVGPDSFDAELGGHLQKLLEHFQDACPDEYLDTALPDIAGGELLDTVMPDKLADILAGCLPLWVATRVESALGHRLKVESCFQYGEISEDGLDIVSFAIRVTPETAVEADPFAIGPESGPRIDICSVFRQCIAKVENRKSIADLLEPGGQIWNDLVEDLENRFERVGFSMGDYRSWLGDT